MSTDYTETLVASRTVYDGKLLTLKEDRCGCRTAARRTREYVLHPGAVDDHAAARRRQRAARAPVPLSARHAFFELPAGKIEPARRRSHRQRELIEETGYVAAAWRHLATLHPCVGYSNERIELYLARELEARGPSRRRRRIPRVRARSALDEALRLRSSTGASPTPRPSSACCGRTSCVGRVD